MREIKFRAWIPQENSKPIMLNWEELQKYDYKQKNYFITVLNDSKCVLMQFTGLKDLKDKEMYEGDIIEYFHTHQEPDKKDVVIFAEGCFRTKNMHAENIDLKYQHIQDDELFWYDCKVIGNIYENKDMIPVPDWCPLEDCDE